MGALDTQKHPGMACSSSNKHRIYRTDTFIGPIKECNKVSYLPAKKHHFKGDIQQEKM